MLEASWEALGQSALLVAVAETGDKTQLLSFVLAAKLRRPVPLVLGIFVATIFNHALAGSLGVWLASFASADMLRFITGGLFVVFGLWALVPDKLDAEEGEAAAARGGATARQAFVTTVIAFFLAEMGDKTQFATIALGAKFQQPVAVIMGTTLGMMAANVPAVFLGDRLAERLPLKLVRMVSAALFIGTGLLTLLFPAA